MSLADRPAERRRACLKRSGQHLRWQRASAVAVRADDLHAVELERPQRRIAGPDARRKNRRQFAIPLASDRRLSGIVRQRVAEEYELGGSQSPAAAEEIRIDCSIAFSERRIRLGESYAEHLTRSPKRELAAQGLPKEDETLLDEHLSSIRDLVRAIASCPGLSEGDATKKTDMKDWPASPNSRATCWRMLLHGTDPRGELYVDQVSGLARFPWLGTPPRATTITPTKTQGAGERGEEGQRILRDICRWHVEEFAYLVAKLKSIRKATATAGQHRPDVVHEHAEAGPHKSSGHIALVAGSKEKLALGRHTKIAGTIGDLYTRLSTA